MMRHMAPPYSDDVFGFSSTIQSAASAVRSGDSDVNHVGYVASGALAIGRLGSGGSLQIDDGVHVINDHGQLVVDVQNLGLLTAVIVVYVVGELGCGLADIGAFLGILCILILARP